MGLAWLEPSLFIPNSLPYSLTVTSLDSPSKGFLDSQHPKRLPSSPEQTCRLISVAGFGKGRPKGCHQLIPAVQPTKQGHQNAKCKSIYKHPLRSLSKAQRTCWIPTLCNHLWFCSFLSLLCYCLRLKTIIMSWTRRLQVPAWSWDFPHMNLCCRCSVKSYQLFSPEIHFPFSWKLWFWFQSRNIYSSDAPEVVSLSQGSVHPKVIRTHDTDSPQRGVSMRLRIESAKRMFSN